MTEELLRKIEQQLYGIKLLLIMILSTGYGVLIGKIIGALITR